MSVWAVAGNLQANFNNIRQASAIPKRQVNHEACEEEIWVDLSLFCFFFTPSLLSLVTQLRCIQSLSLLECFIECVLLWVTSMFHLGKSESTHAALEICAAPKQSSWPLLQIQSMIYGSYRLQESSKPQHELFCLLSGYGWNIIFWAWRFSIAVNWAVGQHFQRGFVPEKSENSSKTQTLKRLIRNRVKNVITMEPSNKSKALHFVKTLLGYSHPVN